jgi:hypothetical protein
MSTEEMDVEEGPSPSDPPIPLGRADRFQVVVHVEAEDLRKDAHGCGAEMGDEGMHVSAETSRRLACDASVIPMTHGANGEVLDVGRKTRSVPAAMRRALDHRDHGCRFPGCGLRYTDAHHIEHWADGGETKLDNLVLLCRRHHRLVHEEGFKVERVEGRGRKEENHGSPQFRFSRPDGTPIPDVPEVVEIPTDPVGEMRTDHEQHGIHPDEWTATPRWNGEALDLDLALSGLMPLGEEDRQGDTNPRVSAETLGVLSLPSH